MALPTLTEFKAMLRVDASIMENDALITRYIVNATAMIETYIGRPILTAGLSGARQFGPTRVAYPTLRGLRVSDDSSWNEYSRGHMPEPSAAPRAIIGAAPLDTLSDYADRFESLVSQAMFDIVDDLYHRRSVNATYESSGGGVATTWLDRALPSRVISTLAPIKALSTT